MADRDRKPGAKTADKGEKAALSREEKLAKALRDNLKRRKAKKD